MLLEENKREIYLGKTIPLKIRKVPKVKGKWSYLGPGIIWASMAMGSGELIWWPYLTAKYGAAFIGIVLPACIMQYFVNQEIGRYTIATGEGLFQGFVRLNYLIAIILWAMMAIGFIWVGSYVSSGSTALFELTKFPRGWSNKAGTVFWSYLTFFIFIIAILFSKVTFKFIETFMKYTVSICIIGILIATIQPQILSTGKAFFSAYFNPLYLFQNGIPESWDINDNSVLLTSICFAGMGGFMNVAYSYWIREKGMGMCSYVGKVTGPLNRSAKEIPESGYIFENNEENRINYKKWMAALNLNNFFAVSINAVVVMLMCWLSWAILLPKGEYPSGWKIAVMQSQFFGAFMGKMGALLFLFISAAFLVDGWIGSVDACCRMHADFFRSTFKFARKYSYKKLYYIFFSMSVIISFLTVPIASPGTLLVLVGVIHFIGMSIYCPILIYLNYFMLPKVYPNWINPNFLTKIIFSVVSMTYILLSIWYLFEIF